MNHFLIGFFATVMTVATVVGVHGQDKRSKEFEKLVASTQPLFVDGERVYRPSEVSMAAIITDKPEPQFTDRARKKKSSGTVLMRAVLKSTGQLNIVNVLKRLPYGLTEQALDGASRVKFKPALLDGKPVSQIIILQYNFNRY